MLEQREWKADSKPMLSGQIESNLLLRLHLEDLERRLEEKENKLTAAHEVLVNVNQISVTFIFLADLYHVFHVCSPTDHQSSKR